MAATAKTWDQRKGLYKSVQVDRDLADLLKLVARDERKSIAEVVSQLVRKRVERKASVVTSEPTR